MRIELKLLRISLIKVRWKVILFSPFIFLEDSNFFFKFFFIFLKFEGKTDFDYERGVIQIDLDNFPQNYVFMFSQGEITCNN